MTNKQLLILVHRYGQKVVRYQLPTERDKASKKKLLSVLPVSLKTGLLPKS